MSACVVCLLEGYRFQRMSGRCAPPLATPGGRPFPADLTVFGTEVCAAHGERLLGVMAPGAMVGDSAEVTYR